MRKSRFTDSQILPILKQNEQGVSVQDLCREHGISSAQFYKWRAKIGGMGCFHDEALERTRRRELAAEENVCRRKAEGRDSPGSPGGKVVKPSERRQMAANAIKRHGISIRLACECMSISESSYYYQAKLSSENAVIADSLLRLTMTNMRWGFGLCFLHLRNVRGLIWNHKRVYRIYRELELIDQVCSIDFMSDSLSDGRLLRTFNVLLIYWANEKRITLMYIQPGKPTQNAYIERFNRTVRHEWLDLHVFDSVAQAQYLATQWLWTYNNERPHAAIGGIPPRRLLMAA